MTKLTFNLKVALDTDGMDNPLEALHGLIAEAALAAVLDRVAGASGIKPDAAIRSGLLWASPSKAWPNGRRAGRWSLTQG